MTYYILVFQNVGLKHTLAQAMSDWYMRSDYDNVKLSRILDIAQDLKVKTIIYFLKTNLHYLFIFLNIISGIVIIVECSAISIYYRFSLFSITARIFEIR